jgi:hypothetical protein
VSESDEAYLEDAWVAEFVDDFLSLWLGFRGFLFWKLTYVVVDPFLNYAVDLLSDFAVCHHFESRAS